MQEFIADSTSGIRFIPRKAYNFRTSPIGSEKNSDYQIRWLTRQRRSYKTRMHSRRMRTAPSSTVPRRSPSQRPPWTETPQTETPLVKDSHRTETLLDRDPRQRSSPPPVNRITDRSKIITYPQLRLRVVNINKVFWAESNFCTWKFFKRLVYVFGWQCLHWFLTNHLCRHLTIYSLKPQYCMEQ